MSKSGAETLKNPLKTGQQKSVKKNTKNGILIIT